MRYINFGPVSNPDGSPTDLTSGMLAGTGRSPEAFAKVTRDGYDCAYCPLGGIGEPVTVDGHPAHPGCAAAIEGFTPERLAECRAFLKSAPVASYGHGEECITLCPLHGTDEKCRVLHHCYHCSDDDPMAGRLDCPDGFGERDQS